MGLSGISLVSLLSWEVECDRPLLNPFHFSQNFFFFFAFFLKCVTVNLCVLDVCPDVRFYNLYHPIKKGKALQLSQRWHGDNRSGLGIYSFGQQASIAINKNPWAPVINIDVSDQYFFCEMLGMFPSISPWWSVWLLWLSSCKYTA